LAEVKVAVLVRKGRSLQVASIKAGVSLTNAVMKFLITIVMKKYGLIEKEE